MPSVTAPPFQEFTTQLRGSSGEVKHESPTEFNKITHIFRSRKPKSAIRCELFGSRIELIAAKRREKPELFPDLHRRVWTIRGRDTAAALNEQFKQ
jgi:hypothetical protein